MRGQLQPKVALPWGKIPDTNMIGRYTGPRDDLEYVKKRTISYPSREFNPGILIFQPSA
jgi:hypothetical protein